MAVEFIEHSGLRFLPSLGRASCKQGKRAPVDWMEKLGQERKERMRPMVLPLIVPENVSMKDYSMESSTVFYKRVERPFTPNGC